MEPSQHIRFMMRAAELAEKGRGLVSPNPVVGAVLVRDGEIIAEDWHRKFGEGHAEYNLLSSEFVVRSSEKNAIFNTDVLYVTLEPCCHVNKKTPPCTDIILEAGVKKVVVGLLDPNPEVSGRGVRLLRAAGVEVVVLNDEFGISNFELRNESKFKIHNSKFGSLVSELVWQNRFFFKWVRDRKPWVSLKIAQTLDGRIVRTRGESLWLTGEETRDHVHQMRAFYDSILVGVKTIISDDSKLTVRDVNNIPADIQPRAIVLDAALSIPLTSAVVRPGTILFRGRQFHRRLSRKAQLIDKGVEVLEVDTNESGYLHLGQILDELAARGITSVYVEGGPSVWSSFLREGFVDELMIYFAPKFLGGGVCTFEDLDMGVTQVRFREMKVLGGDVYWQGAF